MNEPNDKQRKEQDAPQKPETTIRLSDPGRTPGSAEGEREPMEEALGERTKRPQPPSKPT